MLILTRRLGESIIISDNIKVMVLGIKGNQARLGIEAPDDISIHREEVYNKIHGIDNDAPESGNEGDK